MAKKTLKQYKKEFDILNKDLDIYYDELNSGEGSSDLKEKTLDLLEKKEKLAIECIENFPKNNFGYQELAEKCVFKIENIFRIKEIDICEELQFINNFSFGEIYIKFIEILFENFCNTSLDEYYIECQNRKNLNLPYDSGVIWDFIEKDNFSGKAYFLLAKLFAKAGYLERAIDECYNAQSKGFDDFDITDFYTTFEQIKIDAYHCIKHIEIDEIGDCKEIYFLGENGVGKTLLLQAIVKSFDDSDIYNKEELPNEIKAYSNYIHRILEYPNIFAYGTSRFRTGLYSDNLFDEKGYGTLFDRNMLLTDVEWFLKDVQRKELLGKSHISLQTVLQLLKEIVDFEDNDNLKIEYNEKEDKFIFVEKGTKINFEHLAEGYRTTLVWLSDLLSRLIEKQEVATVEEFHGVVLIDEIDMFLHPKWEYSIVKKLRKKLPNIQWFFTTHSPILIMGASEDALFYRLHKENGETKISQPVEGISNLMANSIITSPLFDLEFAGTREMKQDDFYKKELDTSGHFNIYKIHQGVEKKIKAGRKEKNIQITESDIEKWVDEAIDEAERSLE